MLAAKERIGLIRQGENQIWFAFSGAFVLSEHGHAVKNMPCVDHQSGQRRNDQRRTARQQTDSHILHRAGIDEKAHRERKRDPVSRRLQNDAEPKAENQISGQHRQRGYTC